MTTLTTVTGRGLRVTAAFRLPISQYQRLIELAEQRGYMRGDVPNVSEAAREVMNKGLAVLDNSEEAADAEA